MTHKIWDTTAAYSPSELINPWVKINIIQLYDTLTTLQRPPRGSAQCFCGLTVNVNRVRELAVAALTVRIVTAAVEKRCSRLSAACSLHAAMRVCFISHGWGYTNKLALRRIVIISLYQEVSLSGGVNYFLVDRQSCQVTVGQMFPEKSSKDRWKRLERKDEYFWQQLHNYV